MRQLHVKHSQFRHSFEDCFEPINSENVVVDAGHFRGAAETQFS
jgi:hypothetical protein